MTLIEKLQRAAAEIDELNIGLADTLADSRRFRAAWSEEDDHGEPPAVKVERDRWEAELAQQIERNEATYQTYAREIERLQRR